MKDQKESKKNNKKPINGTLKAVKHTIKAMVILTIAFLAIILYFRYGKDVIRMYKDAKYIVAMSSYDIFRMDSNSEIYDCNNKLLVTLNGDRDVDYLECDSIPEYYKTAMIAVEDRKYYKHNGVDFEGMARAFVALIKHDGKITEGGSTITQQLAKNIFLTNEVSWERKVEEVFIAFKLEDKYSKDDIMEFYLNNIYFGNGYYGIGAASEGYFSTSVDKLSLSQIAFLCSVPNNPTYYDPITNMKNTLTRRDKILKNMLEEGYINELEYQLASEEEITLDISEESIHHNYVETYIYYCATKALMEQDGFKFRYKFESEKDAKNYNSMYSEEYSKCQEMLYTQGLKIYTSMDIEKQNKLQEVLDQELSVNDSVSDDGIYKLQGSATVIDNATGRVVAIVGGRSQEGLKYSLNRAFQSPRQPGSAIKPLVVYIPAIQNGYKPYSIVDDLPIEGGPSNSGSYEGDITFEEAVYKSKNVVAYRLYKDITPMVGVQYLLDMKFTKLTISDRENMATCLGGFEYGATSMEMASAYATICNDGYFRNPTCIRKIEDAYGNIVVTDEVLETKIYEQNASRIMTDILTKVFEQGGTAYGYGLPNMSAAGKTGTTNDNKDGWFCGYTPYYTMAVWIGYDMPEKLEGLWGSTYPASIWKNYMTYLNEGLENISFDEYYLEAQPRDVEIEENPEENMEEDDE